MNKKRLLITIGIVAAVVVLVVVFDTILANHRPDIASLEAPERVIASGSCQIVCEATDRDSDELSYSWSASAGELNGEGARVTWIAPNLVGSYDVTVTVADGRGAEAMQQVTITVRTNRSPTITSVGADADWILPSGTIQVTCNATDPDGDHLSYEWTATAGDISGTGAAVNWTAPQEVGIYNVTVVVKDGHASSDAVFVPLSVDLGTPPTVEKLIVTPDGNTFLRRSTEPGCDCDVWTNNEYDIQCIASGTAELVYNWSCTDGEIAGEGSTITWTAPNEKSVEATVTLVVSDAAGNRAVKNIAFHVPSCTCGSWGLKLLEISF
jgi:hypothetical protein